jgi:hypothetical protein
MGEAPRALVTAPGVGSDTAATAAWAPPLPAQPGIGRAGPSRAALWAALGAAVLGGVVAVAVVSMKLRPTPQSPGAAPIATATAIVAEERSPKPSPTVEESQEPPGPSASAAPIVAPAHTEPPKPSTEPAASASSTARRPGPLISPATPGVTPTPRSGTPTNMDKLIRERR